MNSEMKVVKFDSEDVIATSGVTFKLSNLGNSNQADNTFAGVTYTGNYNNDLQNIASAISTGVGYTITKDQLRSAYFKTGTSQKRIGSFMGTAGTSDETTLSQYNGTYKFDGTNFIRI